MHDFSCLSWGGQSKTKGGWDFERGHQHKSSVKTRYVYMFKQKKKVKQLGDEWQDFSETKRRKYVSSVWLERNVVCSMISTSLCICTYLLKLPILFVCITLELRE